MFQRKLKIPLTARLKAIASRKEPKITLDLVSSFWLKGQNVRRYTRDCVSELDWAARCQILQFFENKTCVNFNLSRGDLVHQLNFISTPFLKVQSHLILKCCQSDSTQFFPRQSLFKLLLLIKTWGKKPIKFCEDPFLRRFHQPLRSGIESRNTLGGRSPPNFIITICNIMTLLQ